MSGVKTNSPGRNSKRVKVLAADIGYDSKVLRAVPQRGIRPQLPRANTEDKEESGLTNFDIRATFSIMFDAKHCFNENTVGLLCGGKEFQPVSTLLFPWQPFTFGLIQFY